MRATNLLRSAARPYLATPSHAKASVQPEAPPRPRGRPEPFSREWLILASRLGMPDTMADWPKTPPTNWGNDGRIRAADYRLRYTWTEWCRERPAVLLTLILERVQHASRGHLVERAWAVAVTEQTDLQLLTQAWRHVVGCVMARNDAATAERMRVMAKVWNQTKGAGMSCLDVSRLTRTPYSHMMKAKNHGHKKQ
jgi:hypothetical protein